MLLSQIALFSSACMALLTEALPYFLSSSSSQRDEIRNEASMIGSLCAAVFGQRIIPALCIKGKDEN